VASRKLRKGDTKRKTGPDFRNKFLAKVKHSALTRIGLLLTHEDRQGWKGEAFVEDNYAGDPVRSAYVVQVVLTHHCGAWPIKASVRVPYIDLKNGASLAAQELGRCLGDRAAAHVGEHLRACRGPAHRPYPEQEEFFDWSPDLKNVTKKVIEGKFEEPESPVENIKPKRKVCKICGETDDKFPEWEGDCEHITGETW
jgi:hypothetical protein